MPRLPGIKQIYLATKYLAKYLATFIFYRVVHTSSSTSTLQTKGQHLREATCNLILCEKFIIKCKPKGRTLISRNYWYRVADIPRSTQVA